MILPTEKDEKVVYELRKHWFDIVSVALFFIVFALIPVILVVALINNGHITIPPGADILLFFLLTLWVLFLWITFAIKWTDYYLDTWIITNKRIIDIDQQGLFKRDIATVRIENIQDVKVKVFGIIPTLLRFGDIHLQTSGESREFELSRAMNPEEAKHEIQKLMDEKANEIKTVKMQKEEESLINNN